MEKDLKKELNKVIKKERVQGKLISYMNKWGKIFLYVLPLILVVMAILTLFKFALLDVTLTIVFIVILVVYGINSIILILGAMKTEKSLKMRLNFERRRGRPIDSLDGFDLLFSGVKRVTNLLKVIGLISIVSLLLFLLMVLEPSFADIGFAAIGFALVGFGLALLIRSLNLNIHDVNGLQDFYKPTTHQIFLDNFFGQVFSDHLDPVTYLKWDEYLTGINKLLNPRFIQKVKEQEADELPITFAMESILFLYYLRYQNVINKEQFAQELKEIFDIDSIEYDIEKGLLIEGSWYFSTKDIYKLFEYIKKYNPGFFNIVDRLQLELADNIQRLSNDPIYMDSSAQEITYVNSELNIMIFLYNNAIKEKKYKIKVVATGFDPNEVILNINVEGRGAFLIPSEPVPLISKGSNDIVGILSTMLENGDTTWLTLEPREVGEQTIQIFLMDEDGTIIEGKTRAIKVTKNIKDYFKKLTSIGSLLGGLAVPIARMLPYLLST
ncbi:MAG: hypothetical protein MUP85_22335 [Candidatus Lokiarchaeota archaeon]|nr:hypothetical protein [Candidatus Lokiarchaeota archaeon]